MFKEVLLYVDQEMNIHIILGATKEFRASFESDWNVKSPTLVMR
jgi:hypothetical protein